MSDVLNDVRVEHSPVSGASQVKIGGMRTAPFYVFVNRGGTMRALLKVEVDGTVKIESAGMPRGALVHVKLRTGKTRIVKTEPDDDLFSGPGMTSSGSMASGMAKDLNRQRAASRTAATGGPPALTGDEIPLDEGDE